MILIIISCLAVFGAIIGVIIYHCARRYFGKKVQEYWRQTISANPEYLSQLDVYKPDEWELKRDDLVLEEVIGRGTFGKVPPGVFRCSGL